MAVDHYENFPVASLLCPPAIRPAVVAIYHFARTADDIADEGDAPAAQRLADLAAMRADLQRVAAGQGHSGRWPAVFDALALQMQQHRLPPTLLDDLLRAFEQDAPNPRYADRAGLLDYCSRSANPVGRLLLHLYGVADARSLQRADAICTALQLINFWQDVGVDLRRGRCYLPLQDLQQHGLPTAPPWPADIGLRLAPLLSELCQWSRSLMHDGAPLALTLPGRAGWELRLVVLGGLRIVEKIAAMHYRSHDHRPKLSALDWPLLCWRALRFRARFRQGQA